MGTTTTIRAEQPRIYVVCLAAYNHGILHGAWIDAAQGAWGLWDAVQDMLRGSPIAGAEEWAIHDDEGFGGVHISEYASLEKVADIAAFIIQHGTLGAAVLEYFGSDLGEARGALADHYLGCHASLADYVQELFEETTAVPETLRFYIDWQGMARDAELSGDLFAVQTAWDAVHVFKAF